MAVWADGSTSFTINVDSSSIKEALSLANQLNSKLDSLKNKSYDIKIKVKGLSGKNADLKYKAFESLMGFSDENVNKVRKSAEEVRKEVNELLSDPETGKDNQKKLAEDKTYQNYIKQKEEQTKKLAEVQKKQKESFIENEDEANEAIFKKGTNSIGDLGTSFDKLENIDTSNIDNAINQFKEIKIKLQEMMTTYQAMYDELPLEYGSKLEDFTFKMPQIMGGDELLDTKGTDVQSRLMDWMDDFNTKLKKFGKTSDEAKKAIKDLFIDFDLSEGMDGLTNDAAYENWTQSMWDKLTSGTVSGKQSKEEYIASLKKEAQEIQQVINQLTQKETSRAGSLLGVQEDTSLTDYTIDVNNQPALDKVDQVRQAIINLNGEDNKVTIEVDDSKANETINAIKQAIETVSETDPIQLSKAFESLNESVSKALGVAQRESGNGSIPTEEVSGSFVKVNKKSIESLKQELDDLNTQLNANRKITFTLDTDPDIDTFIRKIEAIKVNNKDLTVKIEGAEKLDGLAETIKNATSIAKSFDHISLNFKSLEKLMNYKPGEDGEAAVTLPVNITIANKQSINKKLKDMIQKGFKDENGAQVQFEQIPLTFDVSDLERKITTALNKIKTTNFGLEGLGTQMAQEIEKGLSVFNAQTEREANIKKNPALAQLYEQRDQFSKAKKEAELEYYKMQKEYADDEGNQAITDNVVQRIKAFSAGFDITKDFPNEADTVEQQIAKLEKLKSSLMEFRNLVGTFFSDKNSTYGNIVKGLIGDQTIDVSSFLDPLTRELTNSLKGDQIRAYFEELYQAYQLGVDQLKAAGVDVKGLDKLTFNPDTVTQKNTKSTFEAVTSEALAKQKQEQQKALEEQKKIIDEQKASLTQTDDQIVAEVEKVGGSTKARSVPISFEADPASVTAVYDEVTAYFKNPIPLEFSVDNLGAKLQEQIDGLNLNNLANIFSGQGTGSGQTSVFDEQIKSAKSKKANLQQQYQSLYNEIFGSDNINEEAGSNFLSSYLKQSFKKSNILEKVEKTFLTATEKELSDNQYEAWIKQFKQAQDAYNQLRSIADLDKEGLIPENIRSGLGELLTQLSGGEIVDFSDFSDYVAKYKEDLDYLLNASEDLLAVSDEDEIRNYLSDEDKYNDILNKNRFNFKKKAFGKNAINVDDKKKELDDLNKELDETDKEIAELEKKKATTPTGSGEDNRTGINLKIGNPDQIVTDVENLFTGKVFPVDVDFSSVGRQFTDAILGADFGKTDLAQNLSSGLSQSFQKIQKNEALSNLKKEYQEASEELENYNKQINEAIVKGSDADYTKATENSVNQIQTLDKAITNAGVIDPSKSEEALKSLQNYKAGLDQLGSTIQAIKGSDELWDKLKDQEINVTPYKDSAGNVVDKISGSDLEDYYEARLKKYQDFVTKLKEAQIDLSSLSDVVNIGDFSDDTAVKSWEALLDGTGLTKESNYYGANVGNVRYQKNKAKKRSEKIREQIEEVENKEIVEDGTNIPLGFTVGNGAELVAQIQNLLSSNLFEIEIDGAKAVASITQALEGLNTEDFSKFTEGLSSAFNEITKNTFDQDAYDKAIADKVNNDTDVQNALKKKNTLDTGVSKLQDQIKTEEDNIQTVQDQVINDIVSSVKKVQDSYNPKTQKYKNQNSVLNTLAKFDAYGFGDKDSRYRSQFENNRSKYGVDGSYDIDAFISQMRSYIEDRDQQQQAGTLKKDKSGKSDLERLKEITDKNTTTKDKKDQKIDKAEKNLASQQEALKKQQDELEASKKDLEAVKAEKTTEAENTIDKSDFESNSISKLTDAIESIRNVAGAENPITIHLKLDPDVEDLKAKILTLDGLNVSVKVNPEPSNGESNEEGASGSATTSETGASSTEGTGTGSRRNRRAQEAQAETQQAETQTEQARVLTEQAQNQAQQAATQQTQAETQQTTQETSGNKPGSKKTSEKKVQDISKNTSGLTYEMQEDIKSRVIDLDDNIFSIQFEDNSVKYKKSLDGINTLHQKIVDLDSYGQDIDKISQAIVDNQSFSNRPITSAESKLWKQQKQESLDRRSQAYSEAYRKEEDAKLAQDIADYTTLLTGDKNNNVSRVVDINVHSDGTAEVTAEFTQLDGKIKACQFTIKDFNSALSEARATGDASSLLGKGNTTPVSDIEEKISQYHELSKQLKSFQEGQNKSSLTSYSSEELDNFNKQCDEYYKLYREISALPLTEMQEYSLSQASVFDGISTWNYRDEKTDELVNVEAQMRSYLDLIEQLKQIAKPDNSAKSDNSIDTFSLSVDDTEVTSIQQYIDLLTQLEAKLIELQTLGKTTSGQEAYLDVRSQLRDLSKFSKDEYRLNNKNGSFLGTISKDDFNDTKKRANAIKDLVLSNNKEIAKYNQKRTTSTGISGDYVRDGNLVNFSAKAIMNDSGDYNIRVMETSMQKYQYGLSKWANNVKGKILSLTEYMTGIEVVQRVFQQIKEGFSFVSELDSALANINMTMGATSTELSDLGKAAIQTGVDLGADASNVLSAVTVYANANETAESILEKAEPTVMLSNASGVDTSTAADQIQAVVNQFTELEGQERRIVSSYEKISAGLAIDFASGIGDMADAVQNAGSVAAESGLDFETFAAITGKVAEKTRQDGSTIGNTLKTTMARISRSSSADEDVTADERSKASAAYASIGINLYNRNGEYQDLSITLDELSKKWGTLTDAEKNYIAEQSAGTRGINVFKAMMDTYQDAVALAEDAVNSPDFIDETQEKYEETIAAHTATLSATVQQLWANLLPTDLINGVLDIGNSILGVITNITGALSSNLGILGSIITAVTAIEGVTTGLDFVKNLAKNSRLAEGEQLSTLQVLKATDKGPFASLVSSVAKAGKSSINGEGHNSLWNVLSDAIVTPIKEGFNNGLAKKSLKKAQKEFNKASAKNAVEGVQEAALQNLVDAEANVAANSISSTGLKGVATSLISGLVANWPVVLGAAATAAIAGFAYYKYTEPARTRESATADYEEYTKKASEVATAQSNLESLYEEYHELAKGVDVATNKNISLSTDEMTRYREVVNELAGTLPSLIQGYDSLWTAIINANRLESTLGSYAINASAKVAQENIDNTQEYVDALKAAYGQNKDISQEQYEKNKLKDEFYKAASNMSWAEIVADLKNEEGVLNTISPEIGLEFQAKYIDIEGGEEAWEEAKADLNFIDAEQEELQVKTNLQAYVTKAKQQFDVAGEEISDSLFDNLTGFISNLPDGILEDIAFGKIKPQQYINDWINAFKNGGSDFQEAFENYMSIDSDSSMAAIINAVEEIDTMAKYLKYTDAEALKASLNIQDDPDQLISKYNELVKLADSIQEKNDTTRYANAETLRQLGYIEGKYTKLGENGQFYGEYVPDAGAKTKYAAAVATPVTADGTVLTTADFYEYLDQYFETGKDPLKLIEFSSKDISKVNDAFKDIGKSIKKDKNYAKDLKDLVKQLKLNNLDDFNELERMLEKYADSADIVKDILANWAVDTYSFEKANSVLEELKENVETVANSIEKVNDAQKSNAGYTGLSFDDIDNLISLFSEVEGFNADRLIEETYYGVRANTQALNDYYNAWKKLEYDKYKSEAKDLQKVYANYAQELANCTAGTQEYYTALNNLQQVQGQLETLNQYTAAFEGQTNAIAEWQRALSNGEVGDTYHTIASSGYKSAKERWDRRELGTNEARTWTQMFTNEDLSGKTAAEIESYMKSSLTKAQRYFNDESPITGLNNVLADLNAYDSTLAWKDSKGFWQIAADADDMSKALKVSKELASAIMLEFEDMGADLTFAEDADYLKDLRKEATSTYKDLKELTGKDYKIDMDANDADEVEDQIEKIKKAMKNAEGEEATYLQTLLDYFEARQGVLIAEEDYKASVQTVANLKENLDSINSKYKTTIEIDFENDDPKYIQKKIAEIEKNIATAGGTITKDNALYSEYKSILDQLYKNQQYNTATSEGGYLSYSEEDFNSAGDYERYEGYIAPMLQSVDVLSRLSLLAKSGIEIADEEYTNAFSTFKNFLSAAKENAPSLFDYEELNLTEDAFCSIIDSIDGIPEAIKTDWKIQIKEMLGDGTETTTDQILETLSESDAECSIKVALDSREYNNWEPEEKAATIKASVESGEWDTLDVTDQSKAIRGYLNTSDYFSGYTKDRKQKIVNIVEGLDSFSSASADIQRDILKFTTETGSVMALAIEDQKDMIKRTMDDNWFEKLGIDYSNYSTLSRAAIAEGYFSELDKSIQRNLITRQLGNVDYDSLGNESSIKLVADVVLGDSDFSTLLQDKEDMQVMVDFIAKNPEFMTQLSGDEQQILVDYVIDNPEVLENLSDEEKKVYIELIAKNGLGEGISAGDAQVYAELALNTDTWNEFSTEDKTVMAEALIETGPFDDWASDTHEVEVVANVISGATDWSSLETPEQQQHFLQVLGDYNGLFGYLSDSTKTGVIKFVADNPEYFNLLANDKDLLLNFVVGSIDTKALDELELDEIESLVTLFPECQELEDYLNERKETDVDVNVKEHTSGGITPEVTQQLDAGGAKNVIQSNLQAETKRKIMNERKGVTVADALERSVQEVTIKASLDDSELVELEDLTQEEQYAYIDCIIDDDGFRDLSFEEKEVAIKAKVLENEWYTWEPDVATAYIQTSIDDGAWETYTPGQKRALITASMAGNEWDGYEPDTKEAIISVITGEADFSSLSDLDQQAYIEYTAQFAGGFNTLTNDLDKEAVVTYTVDHELVDLYTAEDQDAIIHYTADMTGASEAETPERTGTVKYSADDSAILSTAKNRTGKIKYTADDSAVEGKAGPTRQGKIVYTEVNGSANLNGTTKYVRKATSSNSSQSSTTSAKKSTLSSNSMIYQGTAHAQGTVSDGLFSRIKNAGQAFIEGSWGVAKSGMALVGELGREILVRGDRFFTIGNTGPEFVNVQRHDIIFNHRQTEDLLSHGYAFGRGDVVGASNVHGTAYAQGSVSGQAFGNGTYVGSFKALGGAATTTTKATTTNNNTTSNATKAADEFSEKLDEIEIKISRVEQIIDDLDTKGSSAFRTWSSRLSNINSEMSKITEEMDIQQKGYERYMQEANAVGLSETWAAKVREGAIDIEQITDEDLNDKIQEYQEWYILCRLT